MVQQQRWHNLLKTLPQFEPESRKSYIRNQKCKTWLNITTKLSWFPYTSLIHQYIPNFVHQRFVALYFVSHVSILSTEPGLKHGKEKQLNLRSFCLRHQSLVVLQSELKRDFRFGLLYELRIDPQNEIESIGKKYFFEIFILRTKMMKNGAFSKKFHISKNGQDRLNGHQKEIFDHFWWNFVKIWPEIENLVSD